MRTIMWLNRLMLVLPIILLLSLLTPASSGAQEPTPLPTPSIEADQPTSGDALTEDTASPTTQPNSDIEPTIVPATAPAQIAPVAGDASAQSNADGKPQAQTPNLSVKLQASETVRAGGVVTYTYTIVNNSGAELSDRILQAWWNDRDTGSQVLTCTWPSGPALCEPINATVNNLPATVGPRQNCVSGVQPAGSLCYTLPSIPNGGTVVVSLLLRAQNRTYPQTNRPITTLAGSARLVKAATPTQADTVDATTSTLVVGPVLTGTKTPIKPSSDPAKGRIYTGDTATFDLEIGNATGTNDSSNNNTRADARDAVNIVVTDRLPFGSAFVSATAGGTLSQDGKSVVWSFPGPLKPANKIKFQVVYRKVGQLDDRGQCTALRNASWNVTSDEYTTSSTSQTVVNLPSAEVPVVPPVYVQTIAYEPREVLFGQQTRVTITVRNYWPTPVTNASLTYSLQQNVDLGGNPTPVGSSQEQGRSYKWTNITLPAGSFDTPAEVRFSIDLIAKFDTNTGNLGVAQVDTTATTTPDLAQRWDCPKLGPSAVSVRPRLSIRKYSDSNRPRETGSSSPFLVSNNSQFEYAIDVKNAGDTSANNVSVVDTFPKAQGAAFSYVQGSATGPIQPTSTGDGLQWTIPVIPAGETVTLRYQLNVQGDDYVTYCNIATASGDAETVANDPSGTRVCVKISPDIRVTKTVDKPVIELIPNQTDDQSRANRTVRFTMTIKNNESVPYSANLADEIAPFIFKNAVPFSDPNADAGVPAINPAFNSRYYLWPIVTLQPGEVRTAVFDAEVPNVCRSTTLTNKAAFWNNKNIITPVPDVIARVQVNCGQVEYEISADRNTVSLRDRITFTLKLTNKGSNAATNLDLENRMPSGFSFVALEPDSDMKVAPTTAISSTYVTLRWQVPRIEPGKSYIIKYRATSGNAVIQGNQPSEGALVRLLNNGKCPSSCLGDPEGGPAFSYRNIRVEPLATLEPTITEAGCAKPGDTRSYNLSIVNRNSHPYTGTEVGVTLPVGLTYSKPLGSTTAPSVVQDGNQQRLVWANQAIAAPSGGKTFVQNDYNVQLKVGSTFGALRVVAQANSPDGAIPRKEGVVDPTVFVCLDKPLLAINANRSLVKPGGEVVLEIFLANPLSTPYTISIKNQLPPELTFVSFDDSQGSPAPTQARDGLVWNDLVVPATSGNQYGVVVLNFKVKLSEAAKIGQTFDSVVSVLAKTPNTLAIDTTQNKVTLRVAVDTYMPLISQK